MTGIVYICWACRRQIRSTEVVVKTVRVVPLTMVDGSIVEDERVGEWFHAGCFGGGRPSFRETDRGPFSEVLERS